MKNVGNDPFGTQRIIDKLFIDDVSNFFPVDTGKDISWQAPASINTYTNWSEIVDSSSNKLSDVFASVSGRLTQIFIEGISDLNKFQIEISYGDSKVVIFRQRFTSLPLDAVPGFVIFFDIISPVIPAGEKLYYRIMSDGASETAYLNFKYILTNE